MFRPQILPPDDLDNQPSNGLFVVFQRGKLIFDMRSQEPCLTSHSVLEQARWQVRRRHFMGFWAQQPCFALEIDAQNELDPLQFQRGSLFQLLGRVSDQLFALAGLASQLLTWETEHQFCGRCGSNMRVAEGERAMCCELCRTQNYPRISPCVIVLITRGEELLLARNASFVQPMYSTLAGFIEAGETAEETLVREVREEVGVEVANLEYFKSQSWPFPSQLMLGFFAQYAGGDIVCEEAEIADAGWYHYKELPMVPPASSVAGQLIEHYIATLS